MVKNGQPEFGTPLQRLADAMNGASTSVEVHAGDVLDVCALHLQPDAKVKALKEAAALRFQTTGKPGALVVAHVADLKHLIAATLKIAA